MISIKKALKHELDTGITRLRVFPESGAVTPEAAQKPGPAAGDASGRGARS
jgi:hypothetical protein